jgi:exodeoxyribonuclease VII small subunit
LVTKKQALAVQDAASNIPEHFEQAIEQLESIVASMERGDLTLEQSLAAYERGVALARACQTQLEKAEQQVKVLEQDLLRPLSVEGGPSDPV